MLKLGQLINDGQDQWGETQVCADQSNRGCMRKMLQAVYSIQAVGKFSQWWNINGLPLVWESSNITAVLLPVSEIKSPGNKHIRTHLLCSSFLPVIYQYSSVYYECHFLCLFAKCSFSAKYTFGAEFTFSVNFTFLLQR